VIENRYRKFRRLPSFTTPGLPLNLLLKLTGFHIIIFLAFGAESSWTQVQGESWDLVWASSKYFRFDFLCLLPLSVKDLEQSSREGIKASLPCLETIKVEVEVLSPNFSTARLLTRHPITRSRTGKVSSAEKNRLVVGSLLVGKWGKNMSHT